MVGDGGGAGEQERAVAGERGTDLISMEPAKCHDLFAVRARRVVGESELTGNDDARVEAACSHEIGPNLAESRDLDAAILYAAQKAKLGANYQLQEFPGKRELGEVLRDFLVNVLSIAPAEADANACRMEHVISNESFERLKKAAFRNQESEISALSKAIKDKPTE